MGLHRQTKETKKSQRKKKCYNGGKTGVRMHRHRVRKITKDETWEVNNGEDPDRAGTREEKEEERRL